MGNMSLLGIFLRIVERLLGSWPRPSCEQHECLTLKGSIGPIQEILNIETEIPTVSTTQMTDTQKAVIVLDKILDKRENPTTIDGAAVFESSDPSVLSVQQLTDLSCLVKAVGPIGPASVNVKVDVRQGPDVVEKTGRFDFNIVAGEAEIISGTVGTPTEQEETPPPAPGGSIPDGAPAAPPASTPQG